MPPPSQGAERQRRRSGRTGSPWGLRVLVVGGIAGAAWLLSGAAAQADDRDPATGLLGAVVHDITAAPHSAGSGTGKPGTSKSGTGEHLTGKPGAGALSGAGEQGKHLIDRILTTAVQPLDSGDRHDLGAVTTIPKRLVGEVAGDAGSALGGAVRDLAAPVRLTGEAVDIGHIVPAVQAPQQDAPQQDQPQRDQLQQDQPQQDQPRTDQPQQGQPQQDRSQPGTGASPQVTEPAAAVTDGMDVVLGEADEPRADVPLGRKKLATAASAGARDTVRETPDGEGPAQVRLGAANGAPASGSGTATDGGPSAAVLPSAIADSTMACHRLPIATEVEVRRHDAEAPTASPD
ncbi:hypothetical protein COUCH_00840 [Couchioplanes caeruleus]|uniref:hypothetical protein n=1 Tax=Couchioplanes caeruleus TaxID=56438 RepID=UPI0020C0DF47|nr:hypothetical protein [Couchioplanes caeruleus]UQU64944.1 hypothetical protein COUCH_00840 [Couchioplanes caeruleus]